MLNIFSSSTYVPMTKAVVEYETIHLSSNEGVIFVVPEVIKASAERIMFDSLESDKSSDVVTDFGSVMLGSLNREVLSFNRLSVRLLSMVGMDSSTDTSLLRNVIYRVLMEAPADFPILTKLSSRFEYIDMLVDLIGDFRRYGKKADDLRVLCLEEKGKLYEISILLERIDKMALTYNLTVNEDVISKATELLLCISDKEFVVTPRYREICDFIKNKFVICGFGNTRLLTPQELSFIKALTNCNAQVNFYVASSDIESKFFENGSETVKSLTSIGGVLDATPFAMKRETNMLNTVASMYASDVNGYVYDGDKDDSVKIVSYHDYDDMISFMANEINRLVGQEGLRYRDIRIMCQDQSLIDRIKCIFGVFNLQMFIDHKIILLDTPVVRYTLLLLRLSSRNYDIKSVLRLLRTGVLVGGARRSLVDAFDNYCIQENISDKNRLFNKDYYGTKYLVDEDDSENSDYDKPLYPVYDNDQIFVDGANYLYENIVEKILLPIKDVCDRIDSAKTISQKAIVLANHLGSLKTEIEMLRDEFLDRGDYDTSLAIVKGYSEMMSLLSQLSTDLNDVSIGRDQFLSMVMTDMKNKASGAIPLCADSVEICSVSSSAYTPCKVLFVIGANGENFPHKSSRSGILSSEELVGTGLPDKNAGKSRQEYVEACLLLNGAEDKMYLLHYQKDYPSSVLKYFNQAITGDKDAFLVEGRFKTPVYGSAVKPRFKPNEIVFSADNVTRMFDGRSILSVSSVEKYFTCPLQFFLNKGLKIDGRTDNSSIDSREIGLLCHSMLEFAMKDVKEQLKTSSIDELIRKAPEYLESNTLNYYLRAVTEGQISKPDKYLKNYRVNPGLKVMRIFENYYPIALDRIKKDGFSPDDFELKLESLPVKIEPKTNPLGFEFRGSIDRVDVNNGKYRIIDYKTGGKKIEYSHVYDGIQIQPFLYAHGLKLQDKNIENVGYINLFMPTNKTTPGKEEELFTYNSHTNKKVSLDSLMDYSVLKLDEACKNISEGIGYASPAPSVGEGSGGCAYCSFKGSCGRRHDDSLVREKVSGSDAPSAISSYVARNGEQ
ncbi:MAG: PD-(D/E)XK nuclease family protein [Saccharofermentans sp.]|nr:PD-(D/E)XK nuclease family protein [Saccharofermentans sp.]